MEKCDLDWKTCGHCKVAFDSFCPVGAYPTCDKGGFWSKVFASDICPNAPMADDGKNDKQISDENKIQTIVGENIDSVKTFERSRVSLKIQEMTNLVKLIHSLKESYENYKMELRFLSSALMKSNLLTEQECDLCKKYYSHECRIVNPRILKLCDMPDDEYSTDKIIEDAKKELEMKAFNDTLAADRINRLANRVEYYALNFDVFAEKYRFWQARVAYLRNGNYPNPGRSGSDEYLFKTIEWACEALKDFDNLNKRPIKKSN